jgi:hypothetical protein
MNAIPRSLQALIDEARESIASGGRRCSAEELSELPAEVLEALESWDESDRELSEGKYSQELYWRCVAQDCEEDCDWVGAEKAYLEIVSDPECHAGERWHAHRNLSGLLWLLGRREEACGHASAATEAAFAFESEVAYRTAIRVEAWRLVELGRIDEARRLARKGRVIKQTVKDHLGVACLLVVMAACDVRQHRLFRACWKLGRASRLLRWSKPDVPAGIALGQCCWWCVEADRRRASRDSAGEIEALRESVAIARRLTEDPVQSHVYSAARLMRALLATADALQRSNLPDEAALLLDEAHAIHQRWKLPAAALQPRFV